MARQENNALSDQINLVGEGTVFEGTLRANSDVRVSGRIVGKLIVDGKAIVAPEGAIEGEISAKDADIGGSVQGEVNADERLALKSTARVDGNIKAARIVVEEGAIFTGDCEMGKTATIEKESKKGKAEAAKSPAAAPASLDGKSTVSPSKKAAK